MNVPRQPLLAAVVGTALLGGAPTAPTAPVALAALAAIAWPAAAAAAPARPNLPGPNVAWIPAAADADVDRAFARARSENKPVLLYWGATWCPPCNQLKATLFNRQDFAALSRHFVAVHVDGDRPGAQRIGQRFQVSGYPTVVLFGAGGQELTRLPGSVEADQLMAVLQEGLAGGRPVKAVLADALAGKALTAAEWRLLAFHGWETDESQTVPAADRPATLARLAAAAPDGADANGNGDAEVATRLLLKALGASDDGKGLKADDPMRQRVLRVLADPAASRRHIDALTGGASAIVRALEDETSPRRAPLVAAFDAALRRLAADTTLSRGDRLDATIARVSLARLGQPKDELRPTLPEALVAEVREQVARDDREITDGYERQAVITAGAYALARAGLWAESDALLKANLAKSLSPYYLMSQLGGNARRQGRNAEALDWYRQSWEQSRGPATRLQWGSGYLGALIELAPADASRIEKVAAQILREAATDAGSLDGRSVRSLQRASTRLVGWNGDGKHAAVIKRLQAQAAPLCAKARAAGAARREACDKLLKPTTAAAPAARQGA